MFESILEDIVQKIFINEDFGFERVKFEAFSGKSRSFRYGSSEVVLRKGQKTALPVLKGLIHIKLLYWVTQKLPQICPVILRICIGKVA